MQKSEVLKLANALIPSMKSLGINYEWRHHIRPTMDEKYSIRMSKEPLDFVKNTDNTNLLDIEGFESVLIHLMNMLIALNCKVFFD